MIPEVPVSTADVFDIGTHADYLSAGLQAASSFAQGALQIIFGSKVFEEIAGKDDIQGIAFEWPGL